MNAIKGIRKVQNKSFLIECFNQLFIEVAVNKFIKSVNEKHKQRFNLCADPIDAMWG